MRKPGAMLAWPCINITHSRAEKMSVLLHFPSSLSFFFFFPVRPERCLAHLSAKVVSSVCMLYTLCLSRKKKKKKEDFRLPT